MFFHLLFLMALAPFTARAQRPGPALRIRPLTKDAFVFTTWQDIKGKPYPSNGMYVLTKSGVVMIDTPWDTTQFQPLLDSIWSRHKARVIMCLATHWHDDRTNGLNYYRRQGIRTYTTLMTDVLSDKNDNARAEYLIRKDTSFQVGGTRFDLFYPGVGHTPDNIVVWFGGTKTLYGGCFLKSLEATDMGNLANANIYAWTKSIQKVRTRFGKAQFVVPGHQAWGGDELLDHTLDLIRQEVERRKEEDEEND
jgi:metallo-beta-lactamase class B